MGFCQCVQFHQQVFHQSFDFGDFFFGIHTGIQCHLVVPASAGVEFFAHVANAADEDGFHIHMDVLSLFVESHFACFDVF